MTLREHRIKPGRSFGKALAWWLTPSAALIWRLPLLLVVATLGLWFVFRGLVKLAFIFDASAVVSFIFAPIFLPAAALPALCFLFLIRALPVLWQDAGASLARKLTWTVVSLPVALLLAIAIDLIETVAILRFGIRLPRLPLELLR